MKTILLLALLLSPTLAGAQTTRTQTTYDAATSKARTGTDPERVICRTAMETGSLVKRTRRCMTSAQWAMRIRGENDSARNMVRENSGLIIGQ